MDLFVGIVVIVQCAEGTALTHGVIVEGTDAATPEGLAGTALNLPVATEFDDVAAVADLQRRALRVTA